METSIIGGGITGLTTALALQKLGIPYNVYEKAPQLNEVGAGIWMAPNAMKIFEWLGVANDVRENGVSLERVEITDATLKPLRNSDSNFITDSKGDSIVSIHRAKLQSILVSKLPEAKIHLSKEYIGQTEIDGKVIVKFQNEEVRSDVVLGADGIHSKVRNSLFKDTPLRYSGQTCWRGVANISLSESFKKCCIEAWGKHIRFGFSVIAPDKVYWFAVANAENGQKDNKEKLKSNLVAMYKDFAALIGEIIESTDLDTIIRSDLRDLKRLKSWSNGRTCLLGDAAHATTPNMGQGGAQGVEDAYYIGNILFKMNNPITAFQVFEKERRKKVDAIVNTSWIMGKMIHSSIGQPIMKLTNKLTPDSIIAKQMQKLYSIKESFD